MKTLTDHLMKGLLVLIVSFGIGAVPSTAEETTGDPSAKTAKVEALKKLKAENPEEFQRLVKERKEKVKEKLQNLKEKDPEKFKEVTEKIRKRRKEHLQRLREENPEKFREVMQNKMKKLEELKESNPERYEQFLKNHPKAAEKMERHHEWQASTAYSVSKP